MKKRIFAVLLAVCLLVGLMPMNALAAEGEATPTGDAYIKRSGEQDTYYSTLRKAINAATKSGDEIVLVRDVEVTMASQIAPMKDGVTLNLNGKTLTFTGNNCYIFVYAGRTVTVKNGTLAGGDPATAFPYGTLNLYDCEIITTGKAVYNKGTAKLKGCKITGSIYNYNDCTMTMEDCAVTGFVHNYANLALNNCEVDAKNANKTAIQNGYEGATGCVLTLTDSKVIAGDGQIGVGDFGADNSIILTGGSVTTSNYFSVYHNGSDGGFSMTATGAEITNSGDSGTAIYISGSTATTENAGKNQQLVLTNCTVTGPTGIEGKYTDMVITDCEITSTVDEASYTQNSNGSTARGFAVVSTDNSVSDATPAPTGTITIDGGRYDGLVSLNACSGVTNQFSDYAETADYTITGGTFDTDISDYIPEGALLMQNDEGIVVEKEAESGQTVVATVGSAKFVSLQSAINAAAKMAGQTTIQLMAGEFTEGTITLPATLKDVTIQGAENHGTVLKNTQIVSASVPADATVGLSYENIVINGIVFENSYVKVTGWQGGLKSTLKDWTFDNNIFRNIVTSEGDNIAAVGFNLSDTSDILENLTFTNNVIDGVTGASNSGLAVNSSKGNITITGNKISNVAWNAIQLIQVKEGSEITITGNTLQSSADEGVLNLFSVNNGVVLEDNTITTKEGQPAYANFGAEAKVDGKTYNTLADAIAAAGDGDTVTLLKDVTVESGDAAETSAAIIIDKSITLDGDGHAITAASNFGNTNIINVVDSGNVTIKNLTVNGAGSSHHCINVFSSTGSSSKSVVTLENVVTTGGVSGVTIGGSDVTIQGANTNIGTGSWNYAINVDVNSGVNDTSLTVLDGTIGGIYIEHTDSADNPVKVTIKDGNITSVAVKNGADNATAEISGGAFSTSVADYVVDGLNYEANTKGVYTYHATLDEALATGGEVSSIAAAKAGDTAVNVELVDGASKTQITAVNGDTILLPNPTKSGYAFLGWSDGATTYQGGSAYPVTQDVTLTAQWAYIPPAYTVATPTAENGTVSVSPKYAVAGQTVTLTVTPDEGYELDTLTVTDAKGNELTLTDKGDGKYTFKMPSSKVNINASFKTSDVEPAPDPVKDCAKDGTCPVAKYTDVDLTSWYHDGIHYCVANGLMNGTGDSAFDPEGTTSRAMLVTVLYRLEGEPKVGENSFDDVADGEWYTDAIAWAAENKIVEGYGEGKFGPDDSISREQFATILYRYAKYKGYDVTGSADITSYVDGGDTADWAQDALSWAVAEKLINGVGNNTLAPQGDAVRAQMATILYRFCENVVK